MSLTFRLTQEQKQKQKLSLRQRQRLDIIKASRQELKQELRKRVYENPWLEYREVSELASVEESTPDAASSDGEVDWDDVAQPDAEKQQSGMGMPSPSKMPVEEVVRWGERDLLDQVQSLGLSPEEHLIAEHIISSLDEVGYVRLTDEDEKGKTTYVPPEQVAKRMAADIERSEGRATTPEAVEEVLLAIQTLNPPGIAARSLPEALIRKLERHPAGDSLRGITLDILRNHFGLLSTRKYEKLMSAVDVSREKLRGVYALVKRLRPYPGTSADPIQAVSLGDHGAPAPYVEPDFEVILNEATPNLEVVHCHDWSPGIRLSKVHKESLRQLEKEKEELKVKCKRLERALKRCRKDAKERKKLKVRLERIQESYERKRESYNDLQQQKGEAEELVQEVEEAGKLGQRLSTRRKVVEAVVRYQEKFFHEGLDTLRRMTREDVEAVIKDMSGISISDETVRRISNSCYIKTQFGVFKLADLFTSGVVEIEGSEDLSVRVAKRKLQQLIEEENEPLSDGKLADLLEEQGVKVGRTTVGKYRRELGFPTARLRNKI